MELGLNGLPRKTINEVAAYLSMPGAEREKFDRARARRKEQAQRQEQTTALSPD
jgi:hypothetical protein